MKTFLIKSAILLLALGSATVSFGQVSGKITVSKDFYDALKTMHGQNLLKNALSLEVWSVKYFDVQTEVNGVKSVATRIYLQEKWSGGNVPLTEEVAGDIINLKFTVKSLPATGKFALVYALNDYPDAYKTVRFDQKPNDGTGRANLNYQCNFSAMIGEKKARGLYSIAGGKSQTYNINLFSSTQIVALGLTSMIGDFFDDVAEALFEGGKFLEGIYIDATGTLLAQAFGIVQALILDDGVVIPRYRELTDNEYAFVKTKIFASTLPPRDKIIITNLLGLPKRPYTWATGVGGKIMINLGKKGYDNATALLGYYPSGSGERAGQILIHEMTHVWQLHHSDDISFDLVTMKE